MALLARNYYYLVASLPDLVFPLSRQPVSAAAFMDDIAGLLEPEDAELVRVIRLPCDNRNLLNMLASRSEPFDPNGNYDQDALRQAVKQPDGLPAYIEEFILAHKAGRRIVPDVALEDELHWLFYEWACSHANAFIAEWFTFDLNLRNVLAALNVRRRCEHLMERDQDYARCLSSCIICRNEITAQLLKSTAPDFGLEQTLPWIVDLVELPHEDTLQREHAIDQVRWEKLDELAQFSGFRVDAVLAVCVKLMIVERWMAMDPERGRQRFERLVAEMAKKVSGEE